MHQREIKLLNNQLNSGVFALVALIVDKRLFIANVGQVNCFLCLIDKNSQNKIKVVATQTDHTISNVQEVLRLVDLKANIKDLENLETDENIAFKYTRCLGDFKSKANYQEYDIFKECSSSPIIAQPDHPPKSIKIEDNYLFMVMYSEAVGQAIKSTNPNLQNTEIALTEMLLPKIISEQTLNSAAQSVLDEIKRTYDDKFAESYSERGDFTLLIRSFHSDLKNRLDDLVSQNFLENSFTDTNFSNNSFSSSDSENTDYNSIKEVNSYVDLDELNELIKNDDQLNQLVEDLKSLRTDSISNSNKKD